MSKEAMKLALGKIKSARDCHFAAIDTLLFEAEEILEEALAEQPAQQALDKMADNERELGIQMQPAQDDPCPGCRKGAVCRTPKCGRLKLPVDHPYRSKQPAQQEPFGYGRIWWDAKMFVPTLPSVRDGGWLPLYTSPPAQRTWVGLTPEELDEMFSKTLKGKKLVNWVARAIEAKLKEKNT